MIFQIGTPEARQTTLRLANADLPPLGFLSHVRAKSPAQIATVNDLKITSNARYIATQKCQLVMIVVTWLNGHKWGC